MILARPRDVLKFVRRAALERPARVGAGLPRSRREQEAERVAVVARSTGRRGARRRVRRGLRTCRGPRTGRPAAQSRRRHSRQ